MEFLKSVFEVLCFVAAFLVAGGFFTSIIMLVWFGLF